jgi:hypothetical protein
VRGRGSTGVLKKAWEVCRARGSERAGSTPIGQRGGARDKGKTTREGDGLRQRVKGHGASSLARGHGRRRPDGSGRGCRYNARHVLDAMLAFRARSSAVDRSSKKIASLLGKARGCIGEASGAVVDRGERGE